MRSRTLLNLALLLLVVLLGLYVYKTQQPDTDESTDRLTQLNADAIERIQIRHQQRGLELQKQQGRWRMLAPIDIAANDFRIGTLLKLLESTSHAAYAVADLDLEQYGLADATTAIRFNDTAIEFGIVNPINNYRYVRIGDTIHLIDDHYYPLLSSQTGTLVARELIDPEASIEKLVLPDMTLYKDDDGLWQSSGTVDPDAISAVLHEWQHGQAFGVHNYMPRDSVAEISVYLADGAEPIRFEVTDTDPWLIIARPDLDIEYHFNLEFYDRLLRPGSTEEPADDAG